MTKERDIEILNPKKLIYSFKFKRDDTFILKTLVFFSLTLAI
ncbi:MAG: hypothetical protein BAJALOKI2v1_1110004 [Promethearchaeota archaeon]|nr:MAG: hypothetical protein BAJALOKI2v1_1110004 [Candidatus Lokiarchaeota archaeon]